ncbi:MAG: hypothetical protein HYY40_14245 [Bacteroidetes bacterium]|nr:hypothetical protein [Bacteroidota bacterium]
MPFPKKFTTLFTRLKTKWGITSNLQIIIILLVFSLAGMSILKVQLFLLNLMGITHEKSPVLNTVMHIILIPVVYQVVLLAWALVFGQFGFFWDREKKIGQRLMKLFKR